MHGRSSSLATIKIYHNEFCGLTTYKKKYAHFDLVYLLYLSLLIFKRKGHMFVLTLQNADSGIPSMSLQAEDIFPGVIFPV